MAERSRALPVRDAGGVFGTVRPFDARDLPRAESLIGAQFGGRLQARLGSVVDALACPGFVTELDGDTDDEWIRTHEALIAADRWVIDGDDRAVAPARLSRADTVIWIDPPLVQRWWQILRRAAGGYPQT
jgi:hypothetical protein